MNKAYVISAHTHVPWFNRGMEVPLPQFKREDSFFILKRLLDLILAGSFILCFLPFYLILAFVTFASSRGPVLYKQERIGKDGRPFTIYKFRSMKHGAEKNGPLLAVPNDPRITKWGLIMRRYKLDETPQFFHVLQGSMSIVGPRPERAFFRDKLTRSHPRLNRLNRVKPGITSLGQVKYGYASNLEQMHKRARFDMLYLQNLSLWTDFKIIGLTVLHVLFPERSQSHTEA